MTNVEICDAPPARTVLHSTKGDSDLASDIDDKGILGAAVNALLLAGRSDLGWKEEGPPELPIATVSSYSFTTMTNWSPFLSDEMDAWFSG